MPFVIHQSQLDLKRYLFTQRREDFSSVLEGLLEGLGKVRFLRDSLPYEDETQKISNCYKEIQVHVDTKGYHVMRIE